MKRSNKSTSSWVLHMLSSSELITCSAAGSIKAWRTRRRLTLSECERTNLRNKLTSSSKCHLQIWTSCQEFRLFFRPQVSLTTQPPSLPPPIKERTGPIRRSEAGGSSSLTNLFVSSFFNMEEEEEEEEDYSFCVVTLCLDISAPPPPLKSLQSSFTQKPASCFIYVVVLRVTDPGPWRCWFWVCCREDGKLWSAVSSLRSLYSRSFVCVWKQDELSLSYWWWCWNIAHDACRGDCKWSSTFDLWAFFSNCTWNPAMSRPKHFS